MCLLSMQENSLSVQLLGLCTATVFMIRELRSHKVCGQNKQTNKIFNYQTKSKRKTNLLSLCYEHNIF